MLVDVLDWGMGIVKLKIERSKRASVVLPDEEGPERPMRRGLIIGGGVVESDIVDELRA